MKIAVVGAGIAGLSCAYRLAQAGIDVTLFEAGHHFGGHSNTVDVCVDGMRFGVDTGFLVYNEKTYPRLAALFAELGVETAPSAMSFSVKRALAGGGTLEWSGNNLDTVFAQRRNLLRPAFLRMLSDILRFNRQASGLAQHGPMPFASLGCFLDEHGYSAAFRDLYLIPMAACIWSCPTSHMLAFPAATFIRFFHNHGLLQLANRPQWRTVAGGSRNYVSRMLAAITQRHAATPVRMVVRETRDGRAAVLVRTDIGAHWFDHVVLACHSDQAITILRDARPEEHVALSRIAFQANRAVLHTDASCLPANRKTWAAWNYQAGATGSRVCVHYLLNQLQALPCATPVILSLNPIAPPMPAQVLASFEYAHPVFDDAAIDAQRRLAAFQGSQNTWFAGAWTGYGFHEDGLRSGLAVADCLLQCAKEPASVAA